jgi:predicted transcriptional regulator
LDEFDFDERELEVLKLLSGEQNAHYSFQGLRRRLGFHQETLTRTLKRLEEARMIERSPEGYKLRGTSTDYSFTVQTHPSLSKPIINASLPSQVDVTVLFQKLRGRWFSNFRWLGYSTDGNQLYMSWIREDGQMELQARIGNGKITIGVESKAAQNESEQIASAYQLFDQITKVTEGMMHLEAQAPAVAN